MKTLPVFESLKRRAYIPSTKTVGSQYKNNIFVRVVKSYTTNKCVFKNEIPLRIYIGIQLLR